VNESDLRSSTGQLDTSSGEAGWLKRQTADSLMLASYDNLDKSQYGADWRSRRQGTLILVKHTELRRTALLADSSPICREVRLAKMCHSNRANESSKFV
jgi:hypothetical protein